MAFAYTALEFVSVIFDGMFKIDTHNRYHFIQHCAVDRASSLMERTHSAWTDFNFPRPVGLACSLSVILVFQGPRRARLAQTSNCLHPHQRAIFTMAAIARMRLPAQLPITSAPFQRCQRTGLATQLQSRLPRNSPTSHARTFMISSACEDIPSDAMLSW